MIGGHQHAVHQRIGQRLATRGSSSTGFQHDRSDQRSAVRIFHQGFRTGVEQYGKTVIWQIPDQLLPTRLREVRSRIRVDTRRTEH